MSKKDFYLEFKQIEQPYIEMVNNLREKEKEMNESLVEPEFVEKVRRMVDPIIVYYKVWDYIKFILKSKEDFDLAYKQVKQQRTEMVNNLREMEKELNEGLVEPEFVERLRRIVEPINVNFAIWDYIKFILNMPVKKSNKERYIKQNEHLLADKNVLPSFY